MSTDEHAGSKPLAISRPWLGVAGCLGGGVIGVVIVVVLLLAAIALFVFFPHVISGSNNSASAFTTALSKLREAPSLRVFTREIAVHVDATTPTEVTLRAWILPVGPGWPIEVGKTKAEILAPGNRVQYVVPLNDGSEAVTSAAQDSSDPSACVWTVILPPPRVDETLVEVQSDPQQMKISIDRDYVDHLVGDDAAKDAALASIRAAVIREASSETAMFEVREKARATVASMIRALLPEEYQACTILVRWSDEPNAS